MKFPSAGRGFTLLELLVALAVFAVIGIAAYSGLQSVLNTRQVLERESERLNQIQMALLFIERDVEQAASRSVRDAFGQRQSALQNDSGGNLLILTRNGWDNPLRIQRPSLQRVAYRIVDGRLLRIYWDRLDSGEFDTGRQVVLLDQVDAINIRFLGSSGSWINRWPPAGIDDAPDILPRAVEWQIVLQDWGDITRLFLLSGA